jgi:hypothetical protein
LFGLTGLAGAPGQSADEIGADLRTLVTARKHLQQADSWTGLGVETRSPATVLLVQLDEAWVPDAKIDALVAETGMRPASEVGVALG